MAVNLGAWSPSRLRQRTYRKEGRWAPGLLVVLGMLGLLVVGPIVIMFILSFQTQAIGQETVWGLGNWSEVLQRPRVWEATWNTVNLALVRQVLAMIIGVWLAWLIARTDLPLGRGFEFACWVAVFLPTLTITLGWIMIFSPTTGLFNELIKPLGLGPVDIYSWWGIVWVSLFAGSLPIKVMLLTPAFRNLDAALEEASTTVGGSTLRTFRHIIIPIMAPAILVAFIFSMIRSLESFEIELILGLPAGIDVLGTLIYRYANSAPPDFSSASVIGALMLAMLIPLVIWQQRYTAGRTYTTVTGRMSARRRSLGRWKWPIFAIVSFIVLLMTVFPVVMVFLGTFMRRFGRFGIPEPWTLENWETVLGSRQLGDGLFNTIVLAVSTAIVAIFIFTILAYVIVNTRLRGRGVLDFFVWLPSMLPGVVVGLAYVILFLTVPFLRPLYGTVAILVIVTSLATITLSTQMVKSNLRQLGQELEEGSRSAGATWAYTARRIVFPLLAPTIAVVSILAFSSAARATGNVALLSTPTNRPLSVYQLNLMAEQRMETASVVGVIILTITVGVGLIAIVSGFRARGDT
jgi:iron(III) transport system permease protein